VVFNTAYAQYMAKHNHIHNGVCFSMALRKKALVKQLTVTDHFYMITARLFLLALGIGAIIFKLNELYNKKHNKGDIIND